MRSRFFRVWFGVLVLASAANVGRPAAPRYTTLNLYALGFSSACALNNLGHVAGVSADGHLLLWDGQAVHDLGMPSLLPVQPPLALNDRDEIVGTTFLYRNGAFTDMLAVPPSGLKRLDTISAAGTIFGSTLFRQSNATYFVSPIDAAAYAPPAVMESVNALAYVRGTNARGDVVGIVTENGVNDWETYRSRGFAQLGTRSVVFLPPEPGTVARIGFSWPSTYADAVNDSRVVLVRESDASKVGMWGLLGAPYLWVNGERFELPSDGIQFDRKMYLNNWNVAVGDALHMTNSFGLTGIQLLVSGQRLNLNDLLDVRDSSYQAYGLNDRGQILDNGLLFTPTPRTGRLVNVSARAAANSGDHIAISGFVLTGASSGSVLVRTAGPALQKMGLGGAAEDPALKLFDHTGTIVAQNDNWEIAGAAATVEAAAARLGAFPFAAGSKDAALLQTLSAGVYSVHALASDPKQIALTEVYDAGGARDAHLVNASVRLHVGSGDDIGILGFVIGGEGPCRVLIRAVGPGLATAGVRDALPNPLLRVFRGSTALLTNDDWGSAAATPYLHDVMASVGASPLTDDSHDAALLLELEPGAYTAHVRDAAGATGTALIELYVVP